MREGAVQTGGAGEEDERRRAADEAFWKKRKDPEAASEVEALKGVVRRLEVRLALAESKLNYAIDGKILSAEALADDGRSLDIDERS